MSLPFSPPPAYNFVISAEEIQDETLTHDPPEYEAPSTSHCDRRLLRHYQSQNRSSTIPTMSTIITATTAHERRRPRALSAPQPPPYFPVTALEPYLAVIRRGLWRTSTPSSTFLRIPPLSSLFVDEDANICDMLYNSSWEATHVAISQELEACGLSVDVNAAYRTAARDPCGWSGITSLDVTFVDSLFPAEVTNTALSLRHGAKDVLDVSDLFNDDFIMALKHTLRLGVLPKTNRVRAAAYLLPVPGHSRGVHYDGSWMVDSLGPVVAQALGDAMLPFSDYTTILHALFLSVCRVKYVRDACAQIARCRSNPFYRWRKTLTRTEGKGVMSWLKSSTSMISAELTSTLNSLTY